MSLSSWNPSSSGGFQVLLVGCIILSNARYFLSRSSVLLFLSSKHHSIWHFFTDQTQHSDSVRTLIRLLLVGLHCSLRITDIFTSVSVSMTLSPILFRTLVMIYFSVWWRRSLVSCPLCVLVCVVGTTLVPPTVSSSTGIPLSVDVDYFLYSGRYERGYTWGHRIRHRCRHGDPLWL